MNYRLENRDGVVYFIAGNGKEYKLQGLLHTRGRQRDWHDARDDQTLKRLWYRRHVVSRDMPDSKAARADCTDGGTWERKLIMWLDGQFAKTTVEPAPFQVEVDGKRYYRCVIAKRNCKRIASKMMTVHWHKIGKFVASVWRYGSKNREKTMADFGISESNYYWRLYRYAGILGFGNGVDMC